MSVDAYVEKSYRLYVSAAYKFNIVPVQKDEYRDLLFSVASALKDCNDIDNDRPYVIVAVGNLYMKAKKIGENLDISFMDKETFNLTTQFN